jgi:ATP-dependent DNA helicase RecG
LRFFSFYPSHQKSLAPGARVRVFGDVRDGYFGPEIVHPQFKVITEDTALPDRLTPIYPTTAGLSQDLLRKVIERAIAADPKRLEDTLPEEVVRRRKLWKFEDAVRFLHAPPPRLSPLTQKALDARTHPAWTRLKFDELLAQQLSLKAHRKARSAKHAPVLTGTGALTKTLLERVPFKLTRAQERVWREIAHDLKRAMPMQRLLQGDVGSGKTIVAALAALQAIESGKQVAFMAPTELLEEQHFRKLSSWLADVGIDIAWLSGSLPAKERRKALAKLASGEAPFAVGTHALFQEGVTMPMLGLAIVDEQHRFGVAHRLALRDKGLAEAHQLMMSATPIPRTLAMSFYADLDVSVIDTLPPGRTPIATKLISARRREEVFARVRDACMEGGQAYWVCPLIEESEALQLQTAMATHEAIQHAFPELTVGLVHGRLAAGEKADVMARFKRGEIRLLVATTVIEVGVDVPNATLMVIENAERMGLAQLHQLRGRVGRGRAASVCILMYETPLSELARARLKIVYETADGFEIARKDLDLRGPGELLGARQSGMPMLRFADLGADLALLEKARSAAERMLELEPELARAHLERWFGSRHDFLNA